MRWAGWVLGLLAATTAYAQDDPDAVPSGFFFAVAAPEGGPDPAPVTVTLTNGGATQPLNYTVTSDQPWATPAPAAGSLAVGASTDLTISISVAGVPVGVWLALIQVGGDDPNPPPPVRVQLTINAAPRIGVAPASLTFTAVQGGPNPAAQNVTVTNVGSAATVLNFTATPSQPWLAAAPGAGALATGASTAVAVSVAIGGLPPGAFNATVTVSDPAAPNDPQIVNVTLVVAARPVIGVNPAVLTFEATQGGANPPPQPFTITNLGPAGSTLTYTVVTAVPWLAVAPIGGALVAGGSSTHSATADITGLGVGALTVAITVSDPVATNDPQQVSVTLTVRPRPSISLAPASLAFSAVEGDADPSPLAFTVANSGPAESLLAYALADDAAWLSLTAAGAPLAGGASAPHTATASISGLAPGTFAATITASDATATNSPQTIAVTLTVAPRARLAVDRRIAYFAGDCDCTPPPVVVNVANTGSAGSVLRFALGDRPPWLLADVATGEVAAGATRAVTLTADLTGLAVGTYLHELAIADPAAFAAPATVRIAAIVWPTGWFVEMFERFDGRDAGAAVGPYGESPYWSPPGALRLDGAWTSGNVFLQGDPSLILMCLWDGGAAERRVDVTAKGSVVLSTDLAPSCAWAGVWHLHRVALDARWEDVSVQVRGGTGTWIVDDVLIATPDVPSPPGVNRGGGGGGCAAGRSWGGAAVLALAVSLLATTRRRASRSPR